MNVVEIKRGKSIDRKDSLQFLPESLEGISKVRTIKHKNINLKTAYLVDIIHGLLFKYYFKKENSFNLSSIILKEKYGSMYNYYIDYLTINGYIILVRNHLKGKNARIYKLNEDIINGEIKRYRNSDKFLLKKFRITQDIGYWESNEIPKDIKKKLIDDLSYVNVDYSKSIFFLDTTNQDIDIYNKNKYSVDCIKENHIFYHFDEYGRMHTNFTILKSFIRKNCLLIGGEETSEIDIHNSQPLFLCKLIKENDLFIVDNSEFDLFRTLTVNGNFYRYLIDNSDIKDRKEIKEVVYKVLFGRNNKNKANEMFKRLFPTIFSFIKSYKKDLGDYRLLSYSLQRAESNLIFNKVVKTIMKLYPEIKIITVHDSIICAKKYKEVVDIIFKKILKEEFEF